MTPQQLQPAGPNPQPPSRYTNPFATCWTRPGAIPFRFPRGDSAELTVERLAALHWRGAIVGPHGSGKSTLLAAVGPLLAAAGRQVHAVTLRDGQRRLPTAFLARALQSDRAVIVVDGYEQLAWLGRARLRRRCRRAAAGLLVTSHQETVLPTLVRMRPDVALVRQLVATLTARVPSPVTPADVAASLACRGSNVRDVFFDLYDRHERARRTARTNAVSPA